MRGLAFAPNSTDLFASDTASDRLVVIRNPEGDASISEIVSAGSGLSAPGPLSISADGTTAIIANAGGDAIAVVDLRSSTVRPISCSCTPVGFEFLKGAAARIIDPALDADLAG